jgi:hypothetical protein
MIGKVAGRYEPNQQLFHDGFGGVVVGELIQIVLGRECLHG